MVALGGVYYYYYYYYYYYLWWCPRATKWPKPACPANQNAGMARLCTHRTGPGLHMSGSDGTIIIFSPGDGTIIISRRRDGTIIINTWIRNRIRPMQTSGPLFHVAGALPQVHNERLRVALAPHPATGTGVTAWPQDRGPKQTRHSRKERDDRYYRNKRIRSTCLCGREY